MRIVKFVLCLTVCSCGLVSEGLPSKGNIVSRIHHQNVQFGESVRDWFSDMKAFSDILIRRKVTNHKLEDPDKLGQGEFTLIDLNTLKFNPRKDWGFRIGNWYYIQHEDDNTDKNPAGLSGGFNYDDLDDESTDGIGNFSTENGGEGEDEQTTTPLEPDEVSIPTESPNNSVGKKEDENSIKDPQSAEVLTPKAH